MRIRSVAAALLALAHGAGALHAQSPAVDSWGKIYAANNLDNEGYKPFHIVVAYQIYDLKGGPGEKGTIEEWWASPKSHHMTITGPSFPVPGAGEKGSAGKGGETAGVRESYLAHRLINAVLQPVPRFDPRPEDKADEDNEEFGKVSLRCVHLQSPRAPQFRNACMEAGTETVRVLKTTGGDEAITRNAIGKFHDVMVATKVSVGLTGKTAITGDVTTLEGIDPAQHTDVLNLYDPPARVPQVSAQGAGPAGVKAGKLLNREQPVYPLEAKMRHLGGAVILSAVITKTGGVGRLVPIAASDPVFVEAAQDAVRRWKYEPYLLNGEPTEVDTTITVNFNITR